MPRYKFTEQAEQDFDAIVDYTLKNWASSQAIQYVDNLDCRSGNSFMVAHSVPDNSKLQKKTKRNIRMETPSCWV